MPEPELYETYPFVAPEKYKGKLNGKVVLITGASAGIGSATAKAFAAAGAKVACVARREDKLKSVVDEIKSAGNEAIAVVGDVTKRGGPKEIVSQTESQLGPVDIVRSDVCCCSRLSADQCLACEQCRHHACLVYQGRR